ncbi:MAG: GAF domain-containing protein [Actinomycetota bacterium]|nr:GAF domain-containing protein [Actinomycetota bacterium]
MARRVLSDTSKPSELGATERMTLLVAEAGSLFASLHLSDVLPAVIDLAQRVLAADGHGLWLRDPVTDTWTLASTEGISDTYREHVTEAITHPQATMELDGPLIVENVDEAEWIQPAHRDAHRTEGIRAMLVAPLRVGGEVKGTLVFYFRAPRSFDDDEVKVAVALAALAGSAIRTAELYETEARAAEDRRFLAEATEMLASSLDYEETLANVAALAVPQFADWCSIDLVGPGRSIERLTVAHADPEKIQWADELARKYPVDPEAPMGVPNVIRTGEPELTPDIPDELLVEATRDRPELLEVLRQLGLRSAMIVPLAARGRVLGALSFISAESGRRYDEEDLALAKHLARRAALAVDNALLYRDAEEALKARDHSLETLHFLSEASELLASSLEIETTLANVARLVVPAFADWCAVDLLDPDGSMRRLAVVHRDPAKAEWAERSRTQFPPRATESEGTGLVMRTGEPVLYPEITDELLVESTFDEEHLETLRQLGMRSAVVVPLTTRGRILGALMLVSADEAHRYHEEDVALAQEVARRAAVAVENAQLFRAVEGRAQAALALSHVGDGVMLVDRAGIVRLWNPAAERIAGIAEDAVVGRPAGEALDGWEVFAQLAPTRTLDGPAASRPATVPIELGGRELWLSISAVTFAEGAVFAFRDLTEEQAVERMKADFISTVSHELRTPLAAIYGAALTLRREDVKLDSLHSQQLLAVVAEEADRLARIVNDILWASRVDSGSLQMSIESCDVPELARSVIEVARLRLPENVELELSAPADLPRAAADPDKVLQVLTNLVDNAIKYSPDGGNVQLEFGPAGDRRVRIAVRDEGLGIPVPEQTRIFEKFYRLDPNLTRGVGGTGLGLYICRELVRRMDGRIWVETRRPRGTTFVVELPVS